ncbi:UPF0104 family protein, partial [Pyxidicoccus sp. 3LFB2]
MSEARGEMTLGQPVGAAMTVPALPGTWRRRATGVLRPVFALAGLGMLALLVRKAGPAELATVLSEAAAYLPWVVLLEMGRQCLDALATRFAYGAGAERVPLSVLARAQLIGTAVSSMARRGARRR